MYTENIAENKREREEDESRKGEADLQVSLAGKLHAVGLYLSNSNSPKGPAGLTGINRDALGRTFGGHPGPAFLLY